MPANVFSNVATMCSIMLPIITSRNAENIASEMLAIKSSRNVGNYKFPKYWQLRFPEMLAIIFVRNTGDKY